MLDIFVEFVVELLVSTVTSIPLLRIESVGLPVDGLELLLLDSLEDQVLMNSNTEQAIEQREWLRSAAHVLVRLLLGRFRTWLLRPTRLNLQVELDVVDVELLLDLNLWHIAARVDWSRLCGLPIRELLLLGEGDLLPFC